ncbi:hypothetical protein BJX65DRAFT_302452 [Aspergillus insuetus]
MGQPRLLPLAVLYILSFFVDIANALPNNHAYRPAHLSVHRSARLSTRDAGGQGICVPISPVLRTKHDLAAKTPPEEGTCPPNQVPASGPSASFSIQRTADPDDPYSCSENDPCGNGACCARTGVCGYGEDYCGTSGDSGPNDVCWSNCDAKAECGRHSDPPGKECPLNVCCSQYGFCGMTDEFCRLTDDPLESCQSNCDQPESGGSNGDVQKRIIGYYEAWNHKKRCIGMNIQDIPVTSLTHIYYSFAYIEPETFRIVPMNDDGGDSVSADTFTEFADMKRKNPALKAVVALGGWTFNDNHTIWQPVFSDIVSSEANRKRFTSEIMAFMARYGFDGVDIDWEYPGAGDRGGRPEDGVNFSKLLFWMRGMFNLSILLGRHYELSFTAPTSYWYLRHFDIKQSVELADFVNLMSYDLHGVWDRENPIGSQVLAHTNLTEINLALNLLWRNGVDPAKVNLGLGFYGRSFQLADPGCNTPGCLFKGGAAKGPCTDNSGTLSYREIMEIIDELEIKPEYDEVNAVKWITFRGDQWVSYDDYDTFQQKIEFANSLGLGGLLIWAIDLDTPQLDALAAVLAPKRLGSKGQTADAAGEWETVQEGSCYSVRCGEPKRCRAGYVAIETFKCLANIDEPIPPALGGAFPPYPSSSVIYTTVLCCPFGALPPPGTCQWRGGDPYCNGQCHPGEVAVESSKFGDGGYCSDGRKFYCCEAQRQKPDCRWTECGDSCTSDENELTWAVGICGHGRVHRFCCNKDQEWENCAWHGKKNSCFDNHCDTGYQVALTTSHDGEGVSCGFWHPERQRSFCCDAAGANKNPFLPVPLEYLFENPPNPESADIEYELKVDPTWGGVTDYPIEAEPNDAPFAFVVLASPDEIQVSLDKRDGSHWEVFDCFDSTTEGEHTVRMVCTTDGDEDSNCNKIHLGHGAAGTIVQMPPGCGPGKYAVVKSLEPSANVVLPRRLARRELPSHATVYDLTFDYDFRRVPRDMGQTQMRIDYSNDLNYWDEIVAEAATTSRRKRSAPGGTRHEKRAWMEEAWREDVHFGGLATDELHKRWFGSSVLDWLRRVFGTVEKTVEYGHYYREDFIIKILDQRLRCSNLEAKLDVHAGVEVEAEVNYGFTLITTLDWPIDLSKSYLYFRTRGKANAYFTVDAAATIFFDTEDRLLFSADKFGAAFSVPGIVTIGPNFKLFGRLEGAATLGVNFQATVQLAEWDVYQMYPVANEEWEPATSKPPAKRGGTPKPEITWGISASGFITAHVKPTISFGIDFNQDLIPLKSCAVNLVADGYVRFHAEGQVGSGGASFCYGIDAGADLYATIDAPESMQWALPRSPYPILPIPPVQIYPAGGQAACWSPSSSATRGLDPRGTAGDEDEHLSRNISSHTTLDMVVTPVGTNGTIKHLLSKRAHVWGPLLPEIPGLTCPGADGLEPVPPCPHCTGGNDSGGMSKRQDGGVCYFEPLGVDPWEICPRESVAQRRDVDETSDGGLAKRSKKELDWPFQGNTDLLKIVNFPSCYRASQNALIGKWYGFRPLQPCSPEVEKLSTRPTSNGVPDAFVTEHVYEAFALETFFTFLTSNGLPTGYSPATRDWVGDVILGKGPRAHKYSVKGSASRTLFEHMSEGIGSSKHKNLLVLADGGMNGRKEVFMQNHNPSTKPSQSSTKPPPTMQEIMIWQRNTVGVFYYMRDVDIWNIFKDSSKVMEDALKEFDRTYAWGTHLDAVKRPTRTVQPGQPALPTPGLRDLYCLWIDQVLTTAETIAASWHKAAKAEFEKDWGQAGASWVADMASGKMAVSNMKFRAAIRKHAVKNPANPTVWQNSNFEGLWTDPAGPF